MLKPEHLCEASDEHEHKYDHWVELVLKLNLWVSAPLASLTHPVTLLPSSIQEAWRLEALVSQDTRVVPAYRKCLPVLFRLQIKLVGTGISSWYLAGALFNECFYWLTQAVRHKTCATGCPVLGP